MNRILHSFLFLLIFNAIGYTALPFYLPENQPPGMLADTTKPTIFCPNSQIINLAPLRCDTIITYVVNAFDDQGTAIVIMLEGIESGQPFPSGPTLNTFLATDLAGNTSTCSFTISVFEPLPQPICRTMTNVLLNANCTRNLNSFNILLGNNYGCPLHYFVEVDKVAPFGNGPWTAASFTAADVDQEYKVRVTSILGNSSCQGNIVVRDSMPPVFTCQTINVPCALPLQQLTPEFLRDSFGVTFAFPTVSDACGAAVSVSFVDVLQNLPCDDTTTVSGVIRRVWSATDVHGNIGTCEQIIRRQRLLSSLHIPADKITSCSNPDLTVAANGLPYVQFLSRRYEITPASYCEFDVNHFDTLETGSCSGDFIVRRTWKIYDACLPLSATNPKVGVQTIQVKDSGGPLIGCPADMIVTLPSDDCRASLDLPDVLLSDNCSGIVALNAFWVDNTESQTLAGDINFRVDSTGTDTIGVFGIVADFPVGTTTLLYTAEDACGNTGDCVFNLTLANTTPPLAKCDSLLLVSLSLTGYLSVPATVLNDGSTDDCSALFFKAKFASINACGDETALSDTLHICCHNSGDTLLGTLRVYDINVPIGIVSNTFGAGHFSDCNFKIKVTGSSPPTCVAPSNVTVTCADYDPTLESYGDLVSQSCSVDSVSRILSWNNFDTTCFRGSITRLFRVFSEVGQVGQCSQKITVNYVQDYFVKFPDDVIVTACDSTGYYGAPSFYGQDCEHFTITHTDAVFNVVPDACYRIERTWTITNDCTYDASLSLTEIPNPNPNPISGNPENLVGPIVSSIQTTGDPWQASLVKLNPTASSPTDFSIFYNENTNGYEYKQIIKVIDTQKPVIESCQTGTKIVDDLSNNDPLLWNASYWFDPVHVSSDMCEGAAPLSITAYDICSGSDVSISYQLFLDLNGDNIRETIVHSIALPPSNTVYFNNANSGQGISRQFDFRTVPGNQKWAFAIEETVAGNRKTATLRFNTTAAPLTFVDAQLPYGNHKIKWIIKDKCNNESTCEYPFTVRDGKAPTISCNTGMSTPLLSTCMIQLKDTDFLQYSQDNCTPAEYLDFSIRRAGTGTGFPIDANGNPVKNIIFTGADIGMQTVELWSRDKAGNASSCLSNFNIQDPGFCDPNALLSVSGSVQTELNEPLEGASVNALSLSPNSPFSFFNTSNGSGQYTFNAIPTHAMFSVKATLDDNPLNGLTTFDLLQISKHILGVEALGSPYKIIAADANKSNTLTTFDIVELRKVILGLYTEFPNNTPWRFIPADTAFVNPQNPFQPPLKEAILFNNLPSNMTGVDFIGIKVGDVNNSVTLNATAPPDDRSAGTLHFDVSAEAHESVQAGDVFEVHFRSEEDILGCQFTLNYKGLEVLDVQPGDNLDESNFALFPEKKALTMSWENGGTAAFSIKCKAKTAGNLREMLSLNNSITKAEAYRNNDLQQTERFDLALHFPDMGTFELFQNQPNPFAGETDITFNLPEASEATLKISDLSGRILYTQTAAYTRGTHTITLKKAVPDATGVLYYQLETPRYSAVRKMVKL